MKVYHEMVQKCSFYRMEVVLNVKTLEVGEVQTDPFGGLYRPQFGVKVNTFGEPKYAIEWRAKDCVSLGFSWASAWLKLLKFALDGVYPLTDPRIGIPAEVEAAEAA